MSKVKTATIEIYQAFGCYSFCAQVKYYGITLNTFISNDLNEVIELAKSIASEKGFQKTKLNILGG